MVTLTGTASPEALLDMATAGIAEVRAVTAAGASVRAYPNMGNVRDFGAVGDGVANDKAAFIAAAAAHEVVYVPEGAYLFDGAVTGDTRWIIEKGTTFPELPTVGNNALQDMSRLGGRVFFFWDNGTRGGLISGDPDPWPDTIRNPSMSLAEGAFVSPTGMIGVLGASRTSDDLPQNFASIAVCGLSVNDNDTNPEPAWGGYFDARRNENTGAVLGVEIDVINVATTYDSLAPFTTRTNASADLIAVWLSSGGGTGGPANGDASAAIGIHDNNQKFQRGIVYLNGWADLAVNEAVSAPIGARYAWYDSVGLQSWTNGISAQYIVKNDTAGSGYQEDIYRKRANGTDATGSLDEIFRFNGYGYNSGAYLGASIISLQRTAFSGSTARFSLDLTAKNTAGTDITASLNGLADNSFAPFPDNTINLGGSASFRWKEFFCANATINTSDAALKTDVRDLTDAEKAVARRCKSLLKAYRWKDAVAEKGDAARIHFGVIAQEVEAAFVAEGLNAWDYALLCSDPVMEKRTFTRPATRQKTETSIVYDDVVEIVDGKAVKRKSERRVEVPVFDEIPLFEEDGTRAEEPIYHTRQAADGKKNRKQVGTKPAVTQIPVMEEFVEDYEDIVDTGEKRLGVRYSELFAFILAGD